MAISFITLEEARRRLKGTISLATAKEIVNSREIVWYNLTSDEKNKVTNRIEKGKSRKGKRRH